MLNLPPYNEVRDTSWAGYTLQEMHMRRNRVQAHMEIEKYKLEAHLEHARRRIPLFGGEESFISRVANAFTFAEYAFFGVKALKLILPFLRRK